MAYKNRIVEEKVEQTLNLVSGLTRDQWNCIKTAVDYVYSEKAAKTKIDGPEEAEIMKSLLEI